MQKVIMRQFLPINGNLIAEVSLGRTVLLLAKHSDCIARLALVGH